MSDAGSAQYPYFLKDIDVLDHFFLEIRKCMGRNLITGDITVVVPALMQDMLESLALDAELRDVNTAIQEFFMDIKFASDHSMRAHYIEHPTYVVYFYTDDAFTEHPCCRPGADLNALYWQYNVVDKRKIGMFYVSFQGEQL